MTGAAGLGMGTLFFTGTPADVAEIERRLGDTPLHGRGRAWGAELRDRSA